MSYKKGNTPWIKGKKHSAEAIEKMRLAKLGKKHSAEHNANIGSGGAGRKHSEATRDKMSNSHKGKKKTKEHIAKIFASLKGYRPTAETRAKMSASAKGKVLSDIHRKRIGESQRGEKGNNWQGGVSLENHLIRNHAESKLWRKAVFERDNYICQECGVKGGVLNAHHIKFFSTHKHLRTAIDNGITLCLGCHQKKHFYKKAE